MPNKVPGKVVSQVRIDETAYKKMKVIAERENRSINAQLEYFVKKCVAEYEAIHSPIALSQCYQTEENS